MRRISKIKNDILSFSSQSHSALKQKTLQRKKEAQKKTRANQEARQKPRLEKTVAQNKQRRAKMNILAQALMSFSGATESLRELIVHFENDTVSHYDRLLEVLESKLKECFSAVSEGNTWDITGPGKPEILKGEYKEKRYFPSLGSSPRLTYMVEGLGFSTAKARKNIIRM